MFTKSINGNLLKIIQVDEKKAELISQRYALPFVLAKILAHINIEVDEIPAFLEPKIATLMPNPSVLKDVDKMADRVAFAIINKQKIGIIGDYDVDGATSSSLLKLFLNSVGNFPEIHIPDRDEGYGPSKLAIDKFFQMGIDLIITVDCGTTAFEVLEYAKSKNFEVIVIDHHEAEVKLPDVYALINPKRLDETVDITYLAAVGVVFLSIVAINRKLRSLGFFSDKIEPNLMNWLDLVALGTVCDVVPLKGLNRAFVRQGLKVMANRQNFGLKAVADIAGVNEEISAFHLGYMIGPRINACGRVGDANYGNKLLCATNEVEAKILAEKLQNFNTERKEIEAYVLLNAIEEIESNPLKYPVAFVVGSDWHQGVIGIVAGKLKERYNIPAFVMSIEGGEVKGSARSISGLDLGALIMNAKEKGLLISGGGHIMAAGFSLKPEKIEEFKTFVGEFVQQKLGDEPVALIIEISALLDVAGANNQLLDNLQKLEPYGAENSEPKFMLTNVRIAKPSIVGQGHIRCFLSSANGSNLKAMAFKMADTELGKKLLSAAGNVFDLVGYVRKDNWQNRDAVQFIIEDGIIKS